MTIEITQNLVKSLFNYSDGFLYWKNVKSGMVKNGDKAGSLHHTGYYTIGINGKYYSTHRLIYLYFNKILPKEIDHIDGDKSNNNIENLRKVTHQQNTMNRKSDKNSSSKYKGVSLNKLTNKWRARIMINGKQKHLGYFMNEKDAAKAYNNVAIELFNKYAKLNKII